MKNLLPQKYNKLLLLKITLACLVIIFLILFTAIYLFGYEKTSWDVPGSLLAAPLLGHLVYLFVIREEDLD